jgi:ribosomally synthesized peptide (two-chain TOMM family)
MSWFAPMSYPVGGADEPAARVARVGVPEGLGTDFQPGALESSLHWQVIWPRVIAMAWADDEFHEAVKANPRDAIAARFGYMLSDTMKLEVKDAPPEATFVPEDLGPDTDNDPWSKLPPLELTVVIPPRPAAALQAVAITAYQDTGRTYPFTCC